MSQSRHRHAARPTSGLRPVVLWSVPALALTAGMLVAAGVPSAKAGLGCLGIFVIVAIVYVLDRSGLMRPPLATTPSATDRRKDHG